MAALIQNAFMTEGRNVLSRSGLLVLDAHRTSLDIIKTANFLRKTFPEARIIMPMAGYLFHLPLVNILLAKWQKWTKVDLFPVFRKEELNPVEFKLKLANLFYPKSLTGDKKKEYNTTYLAEAAQGILTPQTVVLVAPYGGPMWFGKEIKGGIKKLLGVGGYFCMSYSEVMSFNDTYFSEIFETAASVNYDALLMREFNALFQVEGVRK